MELNKADPVTDAPYGRREALAGGCVAEVQLGTMDSDDRDGVSQAAAVTPPFPSCARTPPAFGAERQPGGSAATEDLMNRIFSKRFIRAILWQLLSAGRKRRIVLDTANGRLGVDSRDWMIGKTLYVERGYELKQINSVCEWMKAEGYISGFGTVLDVGANIGMISIALLRFHYFSRAIAFEPVPDTVSLLRANIVLNELEQRMQVYPCALSSRSGTFVMELSPDNSGDHRIRVGSSTTSGFYREGQRRTITVEASTLNEVFSSLRQDEQERIELIWLDIQGHETLFLQGASVLSETPIPVVSEMWPYGLQRAGCDAADYAQQLGKYFQSFCVVDETRWDFRPISEITSLFKTYTNPRQACTVLLLPLGCGRDGFTDDAPHGSDVVSKNQNQPGRWLQAAE